MRKANGGSFKPGTSGNKGGRPKTLRSFRERLQKHNEESEALLLSCMRDNDGRVAVQALRLYFEYAYGKPATADESASAGVQNITVMLPVFGEPPKEGT
jgi:hypothetical protein